MAEVLVTRLWLSSGALSPQRSWALTQLYICTTDKTKYFTSLNIFLSSDRRIS